MKTTPVAACFDDDLGSILIEALVSAAIVAGVLGLLFSTLADAETRRQGLEARRLALMIAQSRLASVGAEIPIATGETQGAEAGLAWRVRIEPGASEGLAISRIAPPSLVMVSVRRATGGADLVTLSTLRLAAVP